MKLIPKEHDLHVKYVCPNCTDEHWHTQQEAMTEGFRIVCECGKTYELEPVVFNIIMRRNPVHMKKEAINTIGSIYTPEIAKRYVEEALGKKRYGSAEALIKGALAEVEV